MYWLNTFFGLALIAAPFMLAYATNTLALWSSIVLGAVIAVVSDHKAWAQDDARWEGWTDVAVGFLVVLMPFLVGFGTVALAAWACSVLGALIVTVSAVQLYSTKGA